MSAFVDIHCHLLPGVDDGAVDNETALAMAKLAAKDGISTVVATPHQLGTFQGNRGDDIRRATARLQGELERASIPLRILPGADVRIEEGMVRQILGGEVLTLADQGRHVLLELPHEVYFPLERLLASLRAEGIVGILSHPERNAAVLGEFRLAAELVEAGCLMQVTAGSLLGSFGPKPQAAVEWMLAEGLVHFVATDAHGCERRRPLLRRAFERVASLTNEKTAVDLCCVHPGAVVAGGEAPGGRLARRRVAGWRRMFAGRKAS